MPTIRTTQEPWREITVSDGEYIYLARLGLIFTGEDPPLPPPTFSDAQYAELTATASPVVTALGAAIAGSLNESTKLLVVEEDDPDSDAPLVTFGFGPR